MKIEWHPAVTGVDLPEIYAWIALDNPEAAERVLAAVEATFSQIEEQPESGIVYPSPYTHAHKIRMLPVNRFSQYLVFYRIDSTAVRILYVVHGARHLPRLFKHQRRR